MKEICHKKGKRWVVHYRRPDNHPDIIEAERLIREGKLSSYKIFDLKDSDYEKGKAPQYHLEKSEVETK